MNPGPSPSRRSKIIVIGSLVLTLLAIVVFIISSSGRGKSEWDQYRAELTARGEDLSWEKQIPPPVADSENFYKNPIVQHFIGPKGVGLPDPPDVSDKVRPGQKATAIQYPPETPPKQTPLTMQWLKTLPKTEAEKGTNVLSIEALERWYAQWDDMLAGLRRAAKLPAARFDGSYNDPFAMPIPNFVKARASAHGIVTRATVHLAAGKPARALEDLDSLQALMRGLDSEPRTLVSAMINVAMAGLYVQVVQDGFEQGLWTERELEGLYARLTQMNLVKPVQSSLRQGERNGVSKFFDALAAPRLSKTRDAAVAVLGSGLGFNPRDFMIRTMPSGWVRQNQILHARMVQNYIDAMDGEAKRLYPARNDAAAAAVKAAFQKWSPKNMLAAIATPAFFKAARTMAFNQTMLDQGAIAAALELHRLKHGRYPDALSDLKTPGDQPLPHDVITGQPMRYTKTGDTFILYSVGMNERDDNGDIQDSRDWVWLRRQTP